jgi:imidazolonepropionase-like amidohydrolase
MALSRKAAPLLLLLAAGVAEAQVAVRGQVVHTMAGDALRPGVVIARDGKIDWVGPAAQARIPDGFRVLEAAVVTPGLIDAHSVVGLAGILNKPMTDQDQLELSNAIQPELRAIDATTHARSWWCTCAPSASPPSTPGTDRARSRAARP